MANRPIDATDTFIEALNGDSEWWTEQRRIIQQHAARIAAGIREKNEASEEARQSMLDRGMEP